MLNIGIGGTLTFNAGPGLAGMRSAASAFDNLDRARERFSSNLAGLGQQFAQMNLITAGFGIAGVAGIGALIKSGFTAKQTFEDLQVILGSTLGIARGLGFQKGYQLAAQELLKIEQMSFRSPTTAQGLISIYKQIAPPLSTMGASLEQIRNMTLQSSIAAKALGFNMDDIGFGLARMIGGISTSHDVLFRQMKNTGLVRRDMEAEELNSMDPAKRMALVREILKRYGEAAKTVGQTWSALHSAIGDITTKVRRIFVDSGLYKAVKRDADAFVTYYEHNEKMILAGVEKYGHMLVPVYAVLRDAVISIIKHGKEFLDTLDAWGNKLLELQQRFNVSDATIHSIAVHSAQIAMAIGTVIPLLSLFSLVLGPGLRIISTILSGFRIIITAITTIPKVLATAFSTGSLLPFALIVAGIILLFMALRQDGESVGQTLLRLWTDNLKPFFMGVYAALSGYADEIIAPLMSGFDFLREQISFLMDYLSDTFSAGAEDSQTFGNIVGSVMSGIGIVISNVVKGIEMLIGVIIRGIPYVIYILKEMGKYLYEGLVMAFTAVLNVVKGVINAISFIPRVLLDVMGSVLNVVSRAAEIPMVRNLLLKAGIDGTDIRAFATRLQDEAEDLKLDYETLPSFSDSDETPDQEVERKRAERLNKPRTIHVKVEHKSEITVNAKINDKTVAQAVQRHQVEIGERAGAKISPYQRRMAVVHAADIKE